MRSNPSQFANTAERGRRCRGWTASGLPGFMSARSCCAGEMISTRQRPSMSRSSRLRQTTRKRTGRSSCAATESNMSKTRQTISVCRRSTASSSLPFWMMRTICPRSGMPMMSKELFTSQRLKRLRRSKKAIWRSPSGKNRLMCLSATRKPMTTANAPWTLCWQTTSITS